MNEFTLALAFDRDSSDFARGVEVGMIHARLSVEGIPLRVWAHAENAEMILRLAEAHGCSAVAAEIGGDWLEVTFG